MPSPLPVSEAACPFTEPDGTDLLARYLSRTAPGNARTMAGELFTRYGDLNGVCAAAARPGDCALLALVAEDLTLLQALAEALSRPVALERETISSWSQLLAYVRTAMAGLAHEQFRVLYLDNRNRLLRDDWLAEGTVDHAPVYPREVMRRALELAASSMILVHNHPSGDPSPSSADIAMTRQLVDAARTLGLRVHDHLVIGRQGVASFKQLGLL